MFFFFSIVLRCFVTIYSKLVNTLKEFRSMNLESQTTIHTHIHRVCEPYSAQNKNV